MQAKHLQGDIYIYTYMCLRKHNTEVYLELVFFPDLLKMLSVSQLCFALLLVAQLGHISSQYNGAKRENSVGEGLNRDARCSWNCRVIESDFTKQCDPLFTKKRFIKFDVDYIENTETKCSEAAISTLRRYRWLNVWRPANTTAVSSFARGIKGVWNLISEERCTEVGKMTVSCILKPTRTAVRDNQITQKVKKSVEEMGFTFITDEEQPGPLLSRIFGIFFVITFQMPCFYYLPALLCIFSPTVDRENGIPYILLQGAGPFSLRGFLGNKLFDMDGSIFRFSSRCHKAKKIFFGVLFMVIPFLLLAPPLFVANMTPYKVPYCHFNLTHSFVIVCIIFYFLRVFCSSLFLINASRPCHFCLKFSSNSSSCFGILPRRIISHMRLQPPIVVECSKSFVRGLKNYFSNIIKIWKGSTSWVIGVPLVTIRFLVVPFATALLLLAYLTKCLCFLYFTCPLSIAVQDNSFYISPMRSWDRFKRCISNLDIRDTVRRLCLMVGLFLVSLGAVFLSLFVSVGILLTFFLAFTMILLFPEEILPIVTCILLICYYLWSIYSSLANEYHDLSLIIFDFYKRESDCQISSEELCTEGSTNSTDDRDNVLKIPKDLFDMACEELQPVSEAVCLLLLKVILISTFIFLTFYISMELDIDARPLAKTVLALCTGLIPKIFLAYFDGNRHKRIEALAVKEKAPKIIQKYLKRFNDGQSNLGADNQEASVAVQENAENIETQRDSSTDS